MLLALDTSGPAAQVALLGAGGALLSARSEPMATGHAERLLPLVEEVLEGAGARYADLTRVGVTIGPGSFTGVRIALAAARALGQALGVPVVGVSTLVALAAEGERDMPVLAVVDARRGEVYAEMAGPGGFGARVAPIAAVVASITARRYRAVGSGADLIAQADPRAAPTFRAVPDVATIVRLAAAADPGAAPAMPLYLRAPDAKPQAGALPRRA
jgi:tRNA threonylcarbamoyladenosine biosynthesis protein TsaB